jgi:putative endonuclease
MHARTTLGRSGEDAAASLYEHRGYRVIERNYRVRDGEIDLVLRRGHELVFCEVKTRTSERWGEPSEAVRWAKQHRLRRLGAHWLQQRRPGAVDVRFDVASVIVRDGRAEVTLVTDAF